MLALPPDEDAFGVAYHQEVLAGDPEALKARPFPAYFVANTALYDTRSGSSPAFRARGLIVAAPGSSTLFGVSLEGSEKDSSVVKPSLNIGTLVVPGEPICGSLGDLTAGRIVSPGAVAVTGVQQEAGGDLAFAAILVRFPKRFSHERSVDAVRALLASIHADRVVVVESLASPFVELDTVARLGTRAFAEALAAGADDLASIRHTLDEQAPALAQPVLMQGLSAALLSACEARSMVACALLALTAHEDPQFLTLEAFQALNSSLRMITANTSLICECRPHNTAMLSGASNEALFS